MGTTNQQIYNVNYQGVEANLTPPNHRTPKWLAWLQVLLYPLQWLHNNFFNDYANGSVYPYYANTSIYNTTDRVIDIDNAAYECEFNNVFNYSPHLNIGLDIGSYSFTSAGGSTDDLAGGASINMNNFNGPNETQYQIFVGLFGAFNWGDNHGNFANDVPMNSGNPVLLSYGVTVTWGGGTPIVNDHYQWTVSTDVIWWQVNPDYRGVRPRTLFNGQKLVLEGILNQFFRTTFRQPPRLPDIYIGTDTLNNFVFIVGTTEDQSSKVVFYDDQAITYIEYQNNDFSFSDNDFTIYVPTAFYNSLVGMPLAELNLTSAGSGYTPNSVISVVFSGGGGTGATAEADIDSGGTVAELKLLNPGNGYTSLPSVSIPGGSTDAVVTAALLTPQRDNIIRAVADRYVIAGMIYDIKTY